MVVKATGKKRRSKKNLFKGLANVKKKLNEICVLCGIEGFLISTSSLSSPFEMHIASEYPNSMDILLEKFFRLPKRDESKKAMVVATAGEENDAEDSEEEVQEEEMTMAESGDQPLYFNNRRNIEDLDHEELSVMLHDINRLRDYGDPMLVPFQEEAGTSAEGEDNGWLDLKLSQPMMEEEGQEQEHLNTTLCLA